MSFEIKNIEVKSTDNIHTLSGKIYIPDGEIKGILHIVHGMTEYIGRYDRLMSSAAENGYVACGYDNLGHGSTVRDDSELGFIAHKDGWKYLVKDVFTFSTAIKKIYPDKKYILMGHSMGSFIARIAAENFDSSFNKLIFCGTAGKNPLAPFGLLLTDLLKLLKGEKYISKFIQNMAFGSYNKRFEGSSQYEWLTNDKAEIEKYSNDRLCTFKFTVSAMHDLIKLISQSNRLEWFKLINKSTPILLIAGYDDPVGNYGKGVNEVYKKLISLNADVKIKLYENCRHEILNDNCRNEVICDIMRFIS